MKNPSVLIFVMGSLLPGVAGAQTFLIDATTNNGSFESLGGVAGSTAKATHWDTDPDGDVNNWTLFPGVTAFNDSGTEAAGNPVPTHGIRRAFLQNGNATYNMTTHVIQAGDTFTFLWDALNAVAHNVSLVYNNSGTIVTLGAPVAIAAVGNNQTGTYTVAPGDPAIGKTVGIKLASTGGWPNLDNVRLSYVFVAPADSDSDGLPDSWEMANFNNLDQVAGGDPDVDGLINSYELNTSLTHPDKFDTDGDGTGDGAELAVVTSSNQFAPGTPTDPLVADSDHDGLSDGEENGLLNIHPKPAGGGATDPNDVDTDDDGVGDYEEVAYQSDPNDFESRPTPTLHNLIDNNIQNGSFEKVDGVISVAKVDHWDAVVGGDQRDVDHWTEWLPAIGGISTNPGNSGVEGGGTHGAMQGFLRGGDAIYNLSPSSAGEGSVYACTWKQVNSAGNVLTARLVYKDGENILPIAASQASTSTAMALGRIVYRVPAGSPAIGKQIGVAFSSGGGWIGMDEVVLNIADGDSDGDGLGDFDEDYYFGNGDGIPTVAELAQQSGTSDADGDGLNNSNELYVFHTFPKVKDTDGDGLEDGPEVAELLTVETGVVPSNSFNGRSTNPLIADTDGDGLSDYQENGSFNVFPLPGGGGATDPNDVDSDDDAFSDRNEVYYGTNPNDGLSIPMPILYSLINNNLLNGSFEMQSGVVRTVKQAQWDLAAPDDVDNWKLWTEASSAANDSGVEAGGTHGNMRAFLQGGNAIYNMTSNVAAEGAVYSCSWKHVGNEGKIDVQLVYDDGGVIKAIPASVATTNGPGQVGDLVYRIPQGSAAVGKTLGIGVHNVTAGYPQLDEFVLSVVSVDSDGDGLADLWETDNFGPGNLSQSAGGDPDGDGYTNLQEQAAHTNPTSPASNPGDGDSDGMADAWETQYFGNLTQTAEGDFDGDGTLNLTEFRLGLDPASGGSIFAATRSSAGVIQWPSVTGVTFRIQRSITLNGDWQTLENSFPGTAGTASYTDPSPPLGGAFYKVGLNP
ncbi:MAG: hypothetical protein V4584_11290 [Verrucomicrobiota bacterium]